MNPEQYGIESGAPSYSGQPTGNPLLQPKLMIYAACGVATLIAIIVLISAVLTGGKTGTLAVSVSDSSAKISISNAGVASKAIGQGSSVQARVEPGVYTVTATSGAKQSSKTVEVIKGKTASVSLALTDNVPITQVAPYSASSLYVTGNTMFMVNTETQTPFIFKSGDPSGRPYNTSFYPTARIYWLSPTISFVLKNGNWFYINGATGGLLTSDKEYPADPEGVGINPLGNFSYISQNKNVYLHEAGVFKKVTTVKGSGNRTSLAPDGSLLIYPSTGSTETAQLYRNGALNELRASSVSGVLYGQWSPDSKRFCFTTQSGIYIYDTVSTATMQIISANPTNTFSPGWFDDNTVVFAQDKIVWKYSITDKTAVKLASFDGNMTAYNPFSLGPDKQNLYFSTSKDDGGKGGAIYRLLPNYSLLTQAQRNTLDQQAVQPPTSAPTPTNPTASPAAPVETSYDGFDSLVDNGLTTDQLANTKYAIGQFIGKSKLTVKTVAVSGDVSTSHDSNTGDSTSSFIVTLDSARYQVRLQYSGISDTRVLLYNAQGGLVYDSGQL
jgi:hypothetical protein